MVNAINSYSYPASTGISTNSQAKNRLIPCDLKVDGSADTLVLGQGDSLSTDESMGIVVERAMDKLRQIVSDARAALGLPEDDSESTGAMLDTSPDATANRIADFALSAFSAWRKQHTDFSDDEARQQFSDFIGGAIQDGIQEARDILKAVNALTGEVDSNIDTTWGIIQQRLDDFVANKN